MAEGYIEESCLSKEIIAKKILQPDIPRATSSRELKTLGLSFNHVSEQNTTFENIIISSASEDMFRCSENSSTEDGIGSSCSAFFNFVKVVV